jgi:hypothetical protein
VFGVTLKSSGFRLVWLSVGLAALGGVVLAGSPLRAAGAASAGVLSPLTNVSSGAGDPFANCGVSLTSGELARGSQVEPSVAVDPNHPNRVVGAWQQGRFADGGAQGIVAAVSQNAGRTFTTSPLPFSQCAPGGLPFERASDPWVSIGPDGIIYVTALPLTISPAHFGVAAVTSNDGGSSWHNLNLIVSGTTMPGVFDKNSVTADPHRPHTAIATWDHNISATQGPAEMSLTTDGGQHWSAPEAITPLDEITLSNTIVFDPKPNSSTVYDFFVRDFPHASGPDTFAQEVRISTDRGATWPTEVQVGDDTNVGAFNPLNGAPIRSSAPDPAAAVDPVTGELYVVWEDARFNGGSFNEVALSTSTDGGHTWTSPKRVNQSTGRPAFNPMVAVAGDGQVGVTYDDLRTLQPGNNATMPTSYFLATSARGGASFNRQTSVVQQPFDLFAAPFSLSLGSFVGDYLGLAAGSDFFQPFFVQTNPNPPFNHLTDVFTGRFGTGGDTAVAPGNASPVAPTAPAPRRPRKTPF